MVSSSYAEPPRCIGEDMNKESFGQYRVGARDDFIRQEFLANSPGRI